VPADAVVCPQLGAVSSLRWLLPHPFARAGGPVSHWIVTTSLIPLHSRPYSTPEVCILSLCPGVSTHFSVGNTTLVADNNVHVPSWSLRASPSAFPHNRMASPNITVRNPPVSKQRFPGHLVGPCITSLSASPSCSLRISPTELAPLHLPKSKATNRLLPQILLPTKVLYRQYHLQTDLHPLHQQTENGMLHPSRRRRR
jgi:hypothetical protein